MPKPRILILVIVIAFAFGFFPGYLLGRLKENNRYTRILEEGYRWRDECDSLKDKYKHIDIELEVNKRIYELRKRDIDIERRMKDSSTDLKKDLND